MSILDLQQRLFSMDFDPGPIDGIWGRRTESAVSAALDALEAPRPPEESRPWIIPTAWTPAADMRRIHLHWPAGTHTASSYERGHYHFLVEGDGKLVCGTVPVTRNEAPLLPGYAAHTLNANSNAIGIALCGMAGAVERPFNAGRYPLTAVQWETAVRVTAQLCRIYRIPVTDKTVLTHAEIEANLGIKQNAKWDIAILPFAPDFDTPAKVGDRLRHEVSNLH